MKSFLIERWYVIHLVSIVVGGKQAEMVTDLTKINLLDRPCQRLLTGDRLVIAW